MEKKALEKYTEAEIEIIEFDTEDIIITSCTENVPDYSDPDALGDKIV